MTGPQPDSTKARVSRNVDKMLSQGASEAEVEQYIQSEGITPVGKEFADVEGGSSTQPAFNPHNGVDAAADQMLFGFGDEVAAGIRSHAPDFLKGPGAQHTGTYSEELAKEKEGAKVYREGHPKENIAANIVGTLPTMLMSGSGALAKAGVTSGLARAALESAGVGALYGAGNAEEGHRGSGALAGGAVGGAVGGVTNLGLRAIQAALETVPGINKLGSKLGMLHSPQENGDELLLKRMAQDKQTPASVRSQVLARSDTKPETLLDMGGRNVTGLGKRAVNTPGEGQQTFREIVDSRVDAAPSRISEDLDQAGMQHLDRHATAQSLMNAKRQTATPLYEAALRGNPIDDPAINAWLQTPEGRSAFSIAQGIRRKEAEAAALAEGRAVTRADYELPQIYETGAMTQRAPKPGTDVVPFGVHAPDVPAEYETEITRRGVPDDRTLHYLKLALDDMTKFGYVPPGGSASTRNFASKELGGAFRQRIGELIPGYNDAASIYQGGQHMEDAYKAGLGFLKPDAAKSARDLADMTDTEKELFKLGAGNSVRQSTGTAADGTDLARRVFGSPEKRAQLEVAINDPEAFGQFGSQMAREKRMAEVNRLQGGSQTYPMKLEDDDAAQQLGWIARLVSSPLRATGQFLSRAAEGRTPEVNDAVTSRLLAGGNGGRQELLSALEALEQSSLPKFSKRKAIAALMAAAGGTLAGRSVR